MAGFTPIDSVVEIELEILADFVVDALTRADCDADIVVGHKFVWILFVAGDDVEPFCFGYIGVVPVLGEAGRNSDNVGARLAQRAVESDVKNVILLGVGHGRGAHQTSVSPYFVTVIEY